MQATKSIFISKTFWFTVVAAVMNSNLLINIPQPYGILAQSLGTVLLRWVTTQPVTLPGTPVPTPTPPGPIKEATL